VNTWKSTLVVLVLLLAGCGGATVDSDTQSRNETRAPVTKRETSSRPPPGLSTVVIDVSGGKKVEVLVEIADDPFEQARGLMHRTALGEDRGMLFVYPDERPLSYWMKNTLIPLSIAYIDAEGRITDILDMKPLDDTPPHYVSSESVRYALEVNKGFFDERGVKVGDHADLPR
jgi:uncharacterized protein